jgi:hypothetical protein
MKLLTYLLYTLLITTMLSCGVPPSNVDGNVDTVGIDSLQVDSIANDTI